MMKCEHCIHSIRLIKKLQSLDLQSKLNFDLINAAIYWAKKHHDGQLRKSGEPFYTHLLAVAYMVSDYNLKTDVIVASILHDIVEDTEVTLGMLVDNFGWRIAEMVDRLTCDKPDGSKLSVEEILHHAYSKNDTEILLIKIFDRLHNISTARFLPVEKQKRKITETIKNFLILAEEMSLREISDLLYAECLKLNIALGVVNASDIKNKQSVFAEKSILPPLPPLHIKVSKGKAYFPSSNLSKYCT